MTRVPDGEVLGWVMGCGLDIFWLGGWVGEARMGVSSSFSVRAGGDTCVIDKYMNTVTDCAVYMLSCV